MSKNIPTYDFLIVGGGIFGIYAALYLAGRGQRIALVERETALLKKASIVNQARLHSGYHYPRSVATAVMSHENKARFTADHRPFINTTFEKYYAIDRFGSLTDASQFERFCDFIGIPCKPVLDHPLFDYHRIEALYATEEHSFDPILIAQYYEEKVKATKGIDLIMETTVVEAQAETDDWKIRLKNLVDGHTTSVPPRRLSTPLMPAATPSTGSSAFETSICSTRSRKWSSLPPPRSTRWD